MMTLSDKAALWINGGDLEKFFYPFGIKGKGYRVPYSRQNEISRWTFWRAQLPVILWFLGFVPIVDIWGVSLSRTGRLEFRPAILSLVVLSAAAYLLAGVINRVVYSWVLMDCPVLDRFPTRMEKQASAKHYGLSFRNIAFLCFPVATMGIAACALTMALGAIREDLLMWGLGALVSLTFWRAFANEILTSD
jgi:hypothetical protein